MRKEKFKGQSPALRKCAKNENQASKSRHHAAGARSAPFTSRTPCDGQILSPACVGRPFRSRRAPAGVAAAIVIIPSASAQAFAQMAAEEPMMHSPQYNALEGGRTT
jgi:hypothetical protein